MAKNVTSLNTLNNTENTIYNKISFDIFWDKYDKKVGNKKELKKMWDEYSKSTQEEILNYVDKYKAARPDKQYRKNPKNFLTIVYCP